MKKLKFIVSLTNRENDYQIEQATAAQEMAQRLGVEIELLDAENDAILQSQQLLNIIQSRSSRPICHEGNVMDLWRLGQSIGATTGGMPLVRDLSS